MGNWSHKHILSLSNFSLEDYKSVFELTERFKCLNNAGTKKIPALQGNLITSIFFEACTRTRNSFELAAKRLSADVQSFSPSSSSLSKGETWLDTNSTNIFKVFDGSSFQSVKAVASVSSGQPANPVDGQLHWDTSGGGSGVLKIYLASSSAWVNV